MGVFRIARAEFIKIFKKPSVYIMGVILASILVLSLLFFDPIGKQDYNVNITGSSVGVVYTAFMDENDPKGADNKKVKFDAQIAANNTKLEFYSVLNKRTSDLTKTNAEFEALFADLQSAITSKKPTDQINTIYTDVKTKLNEYKTIYENYTTLAASSEFYSKYVELDVYKKPIIRSTKTNTAPEIRQSFDQLIAESTSNNADSFVKYFNNNEIISKLRLIAENDHNAISNSINYYVNLINEKTQAYSHIVINYPQPSYENQYYRNLNDLKTTVTNTEAYIKTLVNDKYTLVFIKKQEYEDLTKAFTSVISYLNSFDDPANASSTKTKHEQHKEIIANIEKIKIQNLISTFASNLEHYLVKDETIKNLAKTLTEKVEPLKEGLIKSINTANKDANSSDLKKIANLNDLITSYRVLALNSETMVNNTLDLEATSQFGSTQINEYFKYDKFNTYEANENLSKAYYYVSNGVYNHHYADVFAFNKNSETKTTALDFMYFSMCIATVIISAFAILMASSLMASEYDSGTVKLLAMRPFKRWKILSGKLMATMFFVLVFILFSSIISFVAGICMYPLNTAPILAVINGSTAFAINPILLMLINIASCIFEVLFYTVLALSISTIFRSYTAAISFSFITFILAFTFNILFGGAFWYSYIPFINTSFFKFFGGSFLTTQTGLINDFFSPVLLSNANLFISLGIYFATTTILWIVTHIIFKARDF